MWLLILLYMFYILKSIACALFHILKFNILLAFFNFQCFIFLPQKCINILIFLIVFHMNYIVTKISVNVLHFKSHNENISKNMAYILVAFYSYERLKKNPKQLQFNDFSGIFRLRYLFILFSSHKFILNVIKRKQIL